MKPGQPPSDDDVGLELDGPTSAALAAEQPGAKIAPPPGNSRLDIGSSTSSGLARTQNEDSHLVVQFTATNLDQRRDVALVVVADGMGGYEAGDQASGIFIRTLSGALVGQLAAAVAVQGQEKPGAALGETIASAIKAANRVVHEQGQKPGCKGMGATAAVLVVWEGQALIGHVGDCRVYHFSGGKLRQVTKDQTLVERMVEMGKLSREEALTHPNRNEVTQAVGRHPNIDPAAHQLEIIPGDWLIVACDGLHAHVDERLLADALRNARPSAALLANDLVELTNRRGGSDNCTVVAVRCY
jgi:protein phosphatase